MALGHLTLSYASLECMLVRLQAALAHRGDLAAADHDLGRRGFSERVVQVLQAASAYFSAKSSLIDDLDLLLSEAADLAHQRHVFIHQKRQFNWQQCKLPVPKKIVLQENDPTPIWDLVDCVDSLVKRLDRWCQLIDSLSN